jgi:hypothetical protein
MSNPDHLAKAKQYIAKGDEYYAKAADELAAWLAEDEGRTQLQAADAIGKSEAWVNRVLRARRTGEPVDHGSGSNKRDEVAAKVLADPVQRRQVLRDLEPEQIEQVIDEANEVAVERARAKRAEQDTTPRPPTARDLTGGEPFDPSADWADTLILRVDTNTRALENHVKQRGLWIGSLGEIEALEYIARSEHRLAEVRAALQERMRDRDQAEAR